MCQEKVNLMCDREVNRKTRACTHTHTQQSK